MTEFISDEQQRINHIQRQAKMDELATIVRDALNKQRWKTWGELATARGIGVSDLAEIVCTRLIIHDDGSAELKPYHKPFRE